MIGIDIEQEKIEIIRKYRTLLRHAKPFLQSDDAKLIRKAFNIALEAHKGTRRRSGEPYIYHPLAVAHICVDEIGLGTTSIVAALLHDVVEDTDIELEDIENDFGSKVASIINGLTKISGEFEYGSSQQAENFRKMLLTLSEDVRVILIKLADRLHNMRTLDSMPRNKQLRISSETSYLYAPLAHRLGLYAIKSEMEDLVLKYTDGDTYIEIIKEIDATKEVRNRFIKRFIRPIHKELNGCNFKFEIKGRPKSIHSIWTKMNKQDIPFDEVYDLFAIRIIIETPLDNEKSACWKVYSIVTDFYKPNPDRLRDWISTPKANGYESLHTTVMSNDGQWVEVQIRAKRMDDIAEKGYAAHWKYKDTAASQESGLEQWIDKIRELLQQDDMSAIEFITDFRSNLFQEEVFVFTPQGDLKRLANGSTALDFAFEIHSEVGMRCLGAKVNQKLVPLHYVLKNGDQVEILTSEKQKPSEDWLRFVVSSKASQRIKEGLKEEKKVIAAEGKEIMLRKLKKLKIDPNNENFDKLRAFFNVNNQLDLFYKMAKGFIEVKDLKKFKEDSSKVNGRKKIGKITDAKSFEKEITKIRKRKEDILLIGEDMDLVDYKFAKCCSPIPGDDVFGFVSVNEGIKIHRTSCPNAPELLSNHGHRVVKAKWASKHQEAYTVGLEILGTDRVGLINDVTQVISTELKVNMRSISVDTDTGIFEGKIVLYINDSKHLDILITRLELVSGVVKVKRFDYTPDDEPVKKQA